MDKYIFFDSFAFLPASHDNLSQLCPQPMKEKYLSQITTDPEKQSLLMRKGCMPYEYLDSFSKFQEECLPPPEAFYSSLTNTTIDPDTYRRLQRIWEEFKCSTLGDF